MVSITAKEQSQQVKIDRISLHMNELTAAVEAPYSNKDEGTQLNLEFGGTANDLNVCTPQDALDRAYNKRLSST